MREIQLRALNFILFPDWQRSEDLLLSEIAQILQAFLNHPNSDQISLIIVSDSTTDEIAHVIVSSVIMQFVYEAALDDTPQLAIAITGSLDLEEWAALSSQLTGRILMRTEDPTAAAAAELLGLRSLHLSELTDPQNQADHWYSVGMTHYLNQEYPAALQVLRTAIGLNPTQATYYYGLGLVLEALSDILAAVGAYQQAIDLDPNLLEARNNLGNLVAQHGDPAQAERIYREAIATNPQYPGSYLNLGNILLVQGKGDPAIAAYQEGLAIDPENVDLQTNLAFAHSLVEDEIQLHQFAADNLYSRKRYAEAIDHYRWLLDRQQLGSSLFLALANCYEQQKQYEAAEAVYCQGLEHHPETIDLHRSLIRLRGSLGQTEAAIAQATTASQQFPEDVLFRLQKFLLLPIIYQTNEEIARYRQRFIQGLTAVIQQTALTTPAQQQSALAAISQHTNFFLAYQKANDLELQRQYGQWVHEIMAANYPHWVQPRSMPAVNGKIRIGYVSGCLRDHTIGKLILGWFRHHNPDRFEIHAYHLFDIDDALSQEFRQYSDAFHQFPEALEPLCERILADHLHLLVFPEIGMQPLMTQVAALRLAPIQCTSWAHPMTSGLPTIDYFLSSDLMEPEDAQAHYSEQLIRIPNLAIAFAKPRVPLSGKPRSDFGLREDAVVYLACQTLCKYLPEQDGIFAAIAQRVPNARFVFVARPNRMVAAQFQQRLQRAFAQVGLDSATYCLMLPPLKQADYWSLNQISDVFLDSIGWSGGHTTLEAIACDLPIVTYPSELMRGRHSYAILKMLGVTDTIATSAADYIDIAVRLGLDPAWRAELLQRMRDRQDFLYDDRVCITALEAFYEQVVQNYGVGETRLN